MLEKLIKKSKKSIEDMLPPSDMKGMHKYAMKKMSPEMEDEEDDDMEEKKGKSKDKEIEIEIELMLNSAKKKKK